MQAIHVILTGTDGTFNHCLVREETELLEAGAKTPATWLTGYITCDPSPEHIWAACEAHAEVGRTSQYLPIHTGLVSYKGPRNKAVTLPRSLTAMAQATKLDTKVYLGIDYLGWKDQPTAESVTQFLIAWSLAAGRKHSPEAKYTATILK